jgi:hypothetical protein
VAIFCDFNKLQKNNAADFWGESSAAVGAALSKLNASEIDSAKIYEELSRKMAGQAQRLSGDLMDLG